MRSLLLSFLVCILSGFVHGQPEEKKAEPPTSGGLAVGKDLPAAITPFNVTGLAKSRFHDPIGPHGLDPFILILTSETDFSDELKKLLQSVDATIEANPAVRLEACAVFFPATIKDNVLTDDDPRKEAAQKLTALAAELGLKHVILAIDSPNNMPKYQDYLLGTRAIVLNKLRVAGIFGGAKFDAQAAGNLQTLLVEQLGVKKQ